jgi:hypothetical protein
MNMMVPHKYNYQTPENYPSSNLLFKNRVSDAEFYLRLRVELAQLGPIE